MRKVNVNIEVELNNNEAGFFVVPVSEGKILMGKYAVVTKKRGPIGWACKNGVQLRSPETNKRPRSKKNGERMIFSK
jgi:hypothetical protein